MHYHFPSSLKQTSSNCQRIFSRRNSYSMNKSPELCLLGVTNSISVFFFMMPIGGGISRTAVTRKQASRVLFACNLSLHPHRYLRTDRLFVLDTEVNIGGDSCHSCVANHHAAQNFLLVLADLTDGFYREYSLRPAYCVNLC